MREPIGIVATLRELERRNKPVHDEETAEVCKGYHTNPSDPAFDPPGHIWRYKEAGDKGFMGLGRMFRSNSC